MKLLEVRMTTPIVWCIWGKQDSQLCCVKVLLFSSRFVVNCLLYQLSIHNTAHCWYVWSHVVCNPSAALCFTDGALYRARRDLAEMCRCTLLPSMATTDFGFPS